MLSYKTTFKQQLNGDKNEKCADFEPFSFMCLDLVLDHQQSFLFQIIAVTVGNNEISVSYLVLNVLRSHAPFTSQRDGAVLKQSGENEVD